MPEIIEPVEDVPVDPQCPVDPADGTRCDACE